MARTAENPIEPIAMPESQAEPTEPGEAGATATPSAAERIRARLPRRPAVSGTSGRRRTRVEIRHVGPFSVLKFSLLFYFCTMLIGFIALFLIYQVLEASGTIDTLETGILGCLFQQEEKPTTGECLAYEINGSVVFTWLFLAGCAGTVVVAVLNTFIALVYNLISDIVGGVEVTLAERGRRD